MMYSTTSKEAAHDKCDIVALGQRHPLMFDTALVTSGKSQSYKKHSKSSTGAFQTHRKQQNYLINLEQAKTATKQLHGRLVYQAYLGRIVLGKVTKHIHC